MVRANNDKENQEITGEKKYSEQLLQKPAVMTKCHHRCRFFIKNNKNVVFFLYICKVVSYCSY